MASTDNNRRKAFGKHKLDLKDKSLLRLIKFVFARHKIRLIVIFLYIDILSFILLLLFILLKFLIIVYTL